MAIGPKKPLQHAAAGEGIFQMQRVDCRHQRQIGCRNRAGQIIDAAPADPEHLRLPVQWQIVSAVDHRFALRRLSLAERAGQKIILQR